MLSFIPCSLQCMPLWVACARFTLLPDLMHFQQNILFSFIYGKLLFFISGITIHLSKTGEIEYCSVKIHTKTECICYNVFICLMYFICLIIGVGLTLHYIIPQTLLWNKERHLQWEVNDTIFLDCIRWTPMEISFTHRKYLYRLFWAETEDRMRIFSLSGSYAIYLNKK